MDSSLTLVQKLAVWALPVIFAITLREIAHGRVARSLGDNTATNLGRLSLNPLNHVDPIGTVLVPGLMLALGGFFIGWGKPVPIDWRNFRHPRRDLAIVAASGPITSLLMAILWGLVYKYAAGTGATEGVWYGVNLMGKAGMVINISLMVLNLLPLPPLDGGRVLVGVLPARIAYRFARVEPYGLMILLLLLATGVLGTILYWPFVLSLVGISQLLGLNPA
jgi:Zn-dependent protease